MKIVGTLMVVRTRVYAEDYVNIVPNLIHVENKHSIVTPFWKEQLDDFD
jgi:hypothetical protein